VYDIYFSFNSDEIREESEPTLTELGDILRRHPDWKLSVAGHTDGIASDAFNLDLSKRRAAAVKKVLVSRFGVNEARLITTGYGKSRPRDTNETAEGRARNRRVELVRIA
jgi:outer membrane protein OmpA-like peptidoglycan-associated protein